jgi:hypothetical protein
MSGQQQMLTLFNLEREARGETALKLDSTLLSQIALNHSQEMLQYGYFAHASPINSAGKESLVNVARDTVNPAFSKEFFGENVASGFANAAVATFGYMYEDAEQEWGHRGAILQGGFTWAGIGVTINPVHNYYTDDFGEFKGAYTPPATADTSPPLMGEVSSANGVATVTGVADNPLNVNDLGANPLTAGITGVVFYTNNIKETTAGSEAFNTVVATQSAGASGTWTAPLNVAPGEVLHAAAVDGSGNYTDKASAPPAMTIMPGANTVALPAGAEATAAALRATANTSAETLAVTPSAAALVSSVDKAAGRRVVSDVRIYVDGHWRTYCPRWRTCPGGSKSFPLYTSEGVIINARARVRWRPPVGSELFSAPTIHLHRGWNFVAAPYPLTHMTCHATRLELARSGDRLQQITVGPSPSEGVIMRPNRKGQWGNDLKKVIDDGKGFWIKDTRSATWVPNPVTYQRQKQHQKTRPSQRSR